MPLNGLDLVSIAAIMAGILSVAGLWVKYRTLPREKVAIQKTIGAGIGHFMQNLSKQAAEEEGTNSSPGTGALNLGGFKIDVKTIAQLAELAKQFGLFKGGGGSSGGGW